MRYLPCTFLAPPRKPPMAMTAGLLRSRLSLEERIKKLPLAFVGALALAMPLQLESQLPRPSELAPKWEPLFNGQDLAGWEVWGNEKWTVQDGEIYGEAVTKGDGFLMTTKTYKSFDLFLRYKCESDTNSGVFFWTTIPENIREIQFVQVEIDNRIGHHTGGLHGDGRSWIVWPPPENETAIRPFDWNEMLIQVHGNRIRTRVNGVNLIDFVYPNPRATVGVIALQLHSGGGGKMRFKDIQIRDFTQR